MRHWKRPGDKVFEEFTGELQSDFTNRNLSSPGDDVIGNIAVADRKQNHYVPRFYMKRFGSTGRSIHLLNTTSMKPAQDASIAGQCQRKHLYNSGLEDGLSTLESFLAREIYQAGSYAEVTTDLWYLFAATQYARVPRESDPGKEFTEAVVDRWLEWQLVNNPEFLERDTSYTITGNSIGMLLGELPFILGWMRGLKVQVVGIEWTGFILGDKPVVLYNQYCEQVEHYAGLGFNRCGVQLFMPLSPKEYLLLYDGQVYDYVKSQQVTYADVETLNMLQIVQSEANVYFPVWADRERLISHTRDVGRSAGYGWPRTGQCSSCPEDVIHMQTVMPEIGLDLSFLKVKRRAARRPIHKRTIARGDVH